MSESKLEKLEKAKKEFADKKLRKAELEKSQSFVKKYFKGLTVVAISEGFYDGRIIRNGQKFVYKGYLKRDDLGYPVLLPAWTKAANLDEYKKLIKHLMAKFEHETQEGFFEINKASLVEKAVNAKEILEGALDEEEEKEEFDFDAQYSDSSDEKGEEEEENEEAPKENQFV